MPNIINNNVLLKEIRRIVGEDIKRRFPKKELYDLIYHLGNLEERIRVLEKEIIRIRNG